MSDSSTAELEATIEQQREQLAETIDALAAKLDVKTQARRKGVRLKHRASASVRSVSQAVAQQGRRRPELVAFVGTSAVTFVVLVWTDRR